MIKNVIKEIFIVILVLVAIVLILGILFYDYVPSNKVAPSEVEAYILSEEMQNELKETLVAESQNIIKTYYIDSSDLKIYEKQNEYDKGKPNPFEGYSTSTQNSNSTNSNTSSNNIANGNSTNNSTTNSGFFNTTGK